MDYLKNDKEGQNKVCKEVEDYAKKYAEGYGIEKEIKGTVESFRVCQKTKNETIKHLAEKYSLHDEDAAQKVEMYWE